MATGLPQSGSYSGVYAGSTAVGVARRAMEHAVEAAHDQISRAECIIDSETIALKGLIGQQVIDHLLPERRLRTATASPGPN